MSNQISIKTRISLGKVFYNNIEHGDMCSDGHMCCASNKY